jgi:ATP-dependent DNA helicase
MRPDRNAQNILSTTRATAKMHEFRVAPEDFIALPRDPAMLFALAVGILGDVAATIAAEKHDGVDLSAVAPVPVPRGWGERDPAPLDGLRFASIFFDAFLNLDFSNKRSAPGLRI